METKFKAGDILEAEIEFDSVDDEEPLKEVYRFLILHVVREESEKVTSIVYVFIMEPKEWDTPYELTLGMTLNSFTQEQLLEHKPKKVGHIDISPLLA